MSKQNAVDLARTARSEAESITKGTKRTIMQILTNWNECVKQAGFMCVYDFPTTGYSRKAQIVADLLRCAEQLDGYCEPNPYAPQTVEQQTREFNAALTRVLDVEEAYAEALEEDIKYQAAIVTIANNLSLPVWDGCSETVKREVMKVHHTEALEMNPKLIASDTWQTKGRGSNDQEYQIYLSCADDGKGNEFMTGKPLKTYEEWVSC